MPQDHVVLSIVPIAYGGEYKEGSMSGQNTEDIGICEEGCGYQNYQPGSQFEMLRIIPNGAQ